MSINITNANKRQAIAEYYIRKNQEHLTAEKLILAMNPKDPVRQERYRLATKMLKRELYNQLDELSKKKIRALSTLYSKLGLDSELPNNPKSKQELTLDPAIVDALMSFLDK